MEKEKSLHVNKCGSKPMGDINKSNIQTQNSNMVAQRAENDVDKQKLRKWIIQSFKLLGYTINADAVSLLTDEFARFSHNERQELMVKLTDHLIKISVESPAIHKEHIEFCLQECRKNAEDKIWNVINIFEIPEIIYSSESNKFILNESHIKKGLFTDARTKIFMHKRRYDILYQRTLRHDFFRQQKMVGAGKPRFYLKTVEWFLCCTEKIEHAAILGLLVQKNETTFGVEDITGTLELDLSKAKFQDYFFPEHCFVLMEGTYDDKIFYAYTVGHPPPELLSKSRSYFGNINTFGGTSDVALTQCRDLKQIQDKEADAMIVFISDVWLDRTEVLDKLKVLFAGFRGTPPLAFVLIGNFLSTRMGHKSAETLQSGLKSLGQILHKERQTMDKSRLILVPGPTDPGAPHILPRPPLPSLLAKDLTDLVPNVVLATNPCRIQYCNREITIIREDVIEKMCRNTIHTPKTNEVPVQFVKTIISQGQLVPLSPNICPVYWNFSHCLDIYPLPDLIVAANQYQPFTVDYMDCLVMNPGTFMKNKFSFRVYIPQCNEIEESGLLDIEAEQS